MARPVQPNDLKPGAYAIRKCLKVAPAMGNRMEAENGPPHALPVNGYVDPIDCERLRTVRNTKLSVHEKPQIIETTM